MSQQYETVNRIRSEVIRLLSERKGGMAFSALKESAVLSVSDKKLFHVILLDLCREDTISSSENNEASSDDILLVLNQEKAEKYITAAGELPGSSEKTAEVSGSKPVSVQKTSVNDGSNVKKPVLEKVETVLRRTQKELSLRDIQDRTGISQADWITDALDYLISKGIVARSWSRKSGGKSVFSIVPVQPAVTEQAEQKVLTGNAQDEKKTEQAAAGPVFQKVFSVSDPKREKAEQSAVKENTAAVPVKTEATVTEASAEEQTDLQEEATVGSVSAQSQEEVSEEDQPADSQEVAEIGEHAVGLYRHLLKELKKESGGKTVRNLLVQKAWPADAAGILPELLIAMAKEGIIDIQTERDSISGVKPRIRYRNGAEGIIPAAVSRILCMVRSPEEEQDEIQETTEISTPEMTSSAGELAVDESDEQVLQPETSDVSVRAGDAEVKADDTMLDDGQMSSDNFVQPPAGMAGRYDSWEILDNNTAIKHCDLSFFTYNGSGIPGEICWFFDAERLRNGQNMPITLIFRNMKYKGKILRESSSLGRIRIFWDASLGSLFKEYRDEKSVSVEFRRENYHRYEIKVVSETEEDLPTTETIQNVEDISVPDTAEIAAASKESDGLEAMEDWREQSREPYGYREAGNGVSVVEEEAEVIRAIYKMRKNGMIMQAIADRLNSLGITTRKGNQFFAVTVSDILKKHRYYQGIPAPGRRTYPVILDADFRTKPNSIADGVLSEEKAESSVQEPVTVAAGLPYGYEYFDKEVRPEPKEAMCVKEVFELYDSNESRTSIAVKMADRKYRTRDGKKADIDLVTEIIQNRNLYTGATGYPAIIAAKPPALAEKEPLKEPEKEPVKEPVAVPAPEVPSAPEPEVPVKSAEPEKIPETVPELKPDLNSVSEPAKTETLTKQEDIQEEIFKVLFENPGYHSVEAIKNLSPRLQKVPDYKIIFNGNAMASRKLIDEIITSPPDPIMYLYAAKIQTPAQQTAPEPESDVPEAAEPEQELSKDQDVQAFFEYCRTTPMSYAYKMILILAFIKHAGDMGNMHIDDAVQFFRQYYDDRRNRGLRVEKGNTIFADPGAVAGSMRKNIIENPVRALKSGGYFTYDSRSELFSMRYFVWKKMSAVDKEEVADICRKRLKQYFSEI